MLPLSSRRTHLEASDLAESGPITPGRSNPSAKEEQNHTSNKINPSKSFCKVILKIDKLATIFLKVRTHHKISILIQAPDQ